MLIVLIVEIGKRVESIQVQDNGERRMTEYTHLVEEILKNRKDFPEVAKLVDALRRQLGDVKVLWCQEGHRQLGTRPDDEIEGSQTR